MRNETVRTAAKNAGVHLWEVAEEIGMCPETFSRKLRHELSEAEREMVLSVIRKISEGRERV